MDISRLTLGQLGVYLNSWMGKIESQEDKDGRFTDLEMFNLMSGIPKKIIKKNE